MSNWCYTTYHFDGPTEEIELLLSNVRKAIKLAVLTESCSDPLWASRISVHSLPPDDEFYFYWMEDEEHPHHHFPLAYLLKLLGIRKEIAMRCRGCIDSERTPVAVTPLSGDRSRLTLETRTAWSASHEIWLLALSKFAPNTKFFYYEEEPFTGNCETNDLLRSHFPGDYVVVAKLPEGSPRELIRTFGNREWRRTREGQEPGCYSYWPHSQLRSELLKYVPNPRLYTRELINKFMNLRFDAADGRRCKIYIRKINRRRL